MAVKKYKNIKFKPRPSAIDTYAAQNNEWVDTRSLEEQKYFAIDEVDKIAEAARSRYITAHPGQIGVYTEKYAESTAYRDAGYPTDLTDYKLVESESLATGLTPQQAADAIISTRNQWIQIAAGIETIRRKAKVDITSATTSSNVKTLKEDAVTQLENL